VGVLGGEGEWDRAVGVEIADGNIFAVPLATLIKD
jgi:hypothetical protein